MVKGDKKKVSTKAQTWSVDLVVGIVVFLLLIVVLYALLSREPAEQKQLRLENDQVLSRFDTKNNVTSGVPGFIENENLNVDALQKLFHNENYNDIKQKLGIRGDFCILLLDDTGGIISFEHPTVPTNPDKLSFGNSADNLTIVNIDDGAGNIIRVYCGE